MSHLAQIKATFFYKLKALLLQKSYIHLHLANQAAIAALCGFYLHYI